MNYKETASFLSMVQFLCVKMFSLLVIGLWYNKNSLWSDNDKTKVIITPLIEDYNENYCCPVKLKTA